MSEWSCEMCGRSLEESLKVKFPMLYPESKNVIGLQYYRIKRDIYLRDRTRKIPKKTCCKSCGYNLSAWSRNFDSKSSYYRDRFTCAVCRKFKEGGRILKSGSNSVLVCRDCHRRKITNELRGIWDITHPSYRAEYRVRYYSKNRKEINRKKRLWRMKRKNLEK